MRTVTGGLSLLQSTLIPHFVSLSDLYRHTRTELRRKGFRGGITSSGSERSLFIIDQWLSKATSFYRISIILFLFVGLFVCIQRERIPRLFVIRFLSQRGFRFILFAQRLSINVRFFLLSLRLCFDHGTYLTHDTCPTKDKYNHKRDNENTYNPNRTHMSP